MFRGKSSVKDSISLTTGTSSISGGYTPSSSYSSHSSALPSVPTSSRYSLGLTTTDKIGGYHHIANTGINNGSLQSSSKRYTTCKLFLT